MTNTKIAKVKQQISKTKETIAACQAKLRTLEKQKTELENLEIIALFRKENLNEDDFVAILHTARGHLEEEKLNEYIDIQ
jgi:DNA-binding transcriptional regulator YiaG